MQVFDVTSPQPLLPFLFEVLQGWKRNTVKARLKSGAVSVNDVVVRRHDHALVAGDRVRLGQVAVSHQEIRVGRFRYQVLYLDGDVIAVDKPAGLLSVATPRENRRTAVANAMEYLASREGPNRAKLWAVHRLDQDVSGVLMFARSEEAKASLQRAWEKVSKDYHAVVYGAPDPPSGTLNLPLVEGGDLTVRVARFPGPGVRDATTYYQTLSSAKGKSLLGLRLETGRKHQIRVHLADLGCPIVGDERYGGKKWSAPGIALHARRIVFPHPTSGAQVSIESPMPPRIEKLVGAAPA